MSTVLAETLVKMEDPQLKLNEQNSALNAAAAAGADHSEDDDDDDHSGDEMGGKGKKGKSNGKSRRELPSGAVATLKAWLLSPEHFTHPYPTPQDQIMLMQKTGIDKKQLKNWFTNARRRIWKPMLKKQLEQGKLAQAGGGPGGAGSVTIMNTQGGAGPGAGMMMPQTQLQAPMSADSAQYSQHWQQPPHLQAQTNLSQPQYDSSGNVGAPGPMPGYTYVTQYPQQFAQQQQQQPLSNQQVTTQQQQQQQQQSQSGQPQSQQQRQPGSTGNQMNQSVSIGSLPPVNSFSSSGHMIKNDSHAVLMELFARDQDLVRQAAEVAKIKAQQAAYGHSGSGSSPQSGQPSNASPNNNPNPQHPMQGEGGTDTAGNTSSAAGTGMPTLNSWPHFSSVSSLNNLGSLAGVKSIQNLSAADLVSQAARKGSLAQIKSQENMGRADSYAFLEVFFDNDMSNKRGAKRDREEDNHVGLSLDGDEPSSSNPKSPEVVSSLTRPAPLPSNAEESEELKRNHDDALAARGLIAVSRSSEKLNELPKKMQRTLSQEYLKQQFANAPTAYVSGSWHQSQHRQQSPEATKSTNSVQFSRGTAGNLGNMYGQDPQWNSSGGGGGTQQPASVSDPSMANDSVEVPVSTKCSICHQVDIDTQLLPCGHMFHGRCLKPSLQHAMGPPKCPVDHTPMQSAVLAVPTASNAQLSGPS